jgi:hypothetical protein
MSAEPAGLCGRLTRLLPDSRLPDQPSHHIPAEQRLGHISFDEGPAVDHLVLLQARVPLPDLVHPHYPVVMPLVRPRLGGRSARRTGAAQRDNPHVWVHSGPGGVHLGAMAGRSGLDGADLLLAQPPERVQEPGAERAVLVLVQDGARSVLAKQQRRNN